MFPLTLAVVMLANLLSSRPNTNSKSGRGSRPVRHTFLNEGERENVLPAPLLFVFVYHINYNLRHSRVVLCVLERVWRRTLKVSQL